MKKLTLITAIILTTSLLFGQWNNYNLIMEDTELFDVHFTDQMQGWMVGEKSGLVIYHTSDGGNTLEIQYENSNYFSGYPSSVCFVNSSTGWVAGDGVILHTNDGGQTWVEQGDGIAIGGGGRISVFFIDDNKGWVAGSHTILKTEDGGETWDSQNFLSGSLYDIQFKDEYHGWAVGISGSSGILLKTTDGGVSWDQTIMDDIRLQDIFFVSLDEGWMIGQEKQAGYIYDFRIFHTIDGGVTWEEEFSGNHVDNWDMSIFFTDSQHGWASYKGMDEYILFTEDGGNNWIERDDIIIIGYDGNVRSIYFSDDQYGYMVGSNGNFLRSQDSGQSWATKGFYGTVINSVSFSDQQNGVALAGYLQGTMVGMYWIEYLLKTNDGGENWIVLRQLTGDDNGIWSYKLFMHDSLHFTLIPNDINSTCTTYIYQSQDGGLSWDTIPLPGNSTTMCRGKFINPDTGWIVKSIDYQGTSVLRTYNGGSTWEDFEMSSNEFNPKSVFFFPSSENSMFGCAVGDISGSIGIIFITNNEGETWSQSEWNVPLNDVFFTDELNGWIVGGDMDNDETIILYTTDGGQTWATQESGTDNGLNEVWFTNAETGWIAGNNGCILYTSNGGENWEASPCPVDEDLYDVFFLDEQTGWVSGNGAILEYDGIWTEVKPGYKIKSNIDFDIHPNPVLSTTIISFKTKQKQNIELSIYDLSGKIIRKQTNEVQANGEYHWQFDLSELNTGIYLCQLKAGEKILTKKIIKVK